MIDELKQVAESRKETLTILFNRMISRLDVLPPYDIIQFTNPFSDILVSMVIQLESYKEEKEVDDIINTALNK